MDFMTLWGSAPDSSSLHHMLLVAWRVILVVLGINALIIVHEWGHFIVARMCGVRCDKFYIWFDAWGFKFFHFKWGDTEYGLGWLPLGGYVKMLGQEDNPGGIKAELDRAKAEVAELSETDDPDAKAAAARKAEETAALEKTMYAPDSYLAKNVPQRMAIISAGVVMNIIFAFVCAVGAAMLGFPEASSRVGTVLPGTPAWQQGIRAGDHIVKMNGEPVSAFSQVPISLINGESIAVDLTRKPLGEEEPTTVSVEVQPKLTKGGMTPTIGIMPASSVKLADLKQPWYHGFSAEKNKLRDEQYGVLAAGDTLVAMNDVPVQNPGDYEQILRCFIDKPIAFTFQPKKQGQEQKTVVADPQPWHETGLTLKMGEVTSLIKGSPADRAGVRVQQRNEKGEITQHGDILFAVNNEPILNALKFPYKVWASCHGAAGESPRTTSLVLTVRRDGELVDLPMSVSTDSPYTGFRTNKSQLACGFLGLCYEVLPCIGAIDESIACEDQASPLDGRIESILIQLQKPDSSADQETREVYKSLAELGTVTEGGIEIKSKPGRLDSTVVYWFATGINYFPAGTPVSVTVKTTEDQTVNLVTTIREANDAYRVDRGLIFGTDVIQRKAPSLAAAVSFGWHKTVEMMGLVYKFLRHIGGTVSVKALGGPGMIIDAAYKTASSGGGVFLLFLCMISANLAVVNFLPIPVLDGGHIVFLLYEAIFRRPPNENIQIILSYLGLFLILGLMFWVIYLDVLRYVIGSL
ncbi:MAG: site-2 protease family protein [Planctomycetia bacterium]|nr:site-2 protease family protein [Planctomycetia bacterium]